MLISKGYVTRRAGLARVVAAIAAGAVIAGCGSGGGGTTAPAKPSPSAATPVISSSGAGLQDGSSGSSGSGPVAGSISGHATGSFSSGSAGQISQSSETTFSTSHSVVTTQSSQNAELMTPAQLKRAQQQADEQASKPATTTTTASTTPASTPTSKPSGGSTSSPSTKPTAASPPPAEQTTTRTKVLVIHRTKVYTIWRNRTITKTITKTLVPKVPAGAFMPSKHPELGQAVFTIAGVNVGCVLAPSGVRCGIKHSAWTAPAEPKSCKSATWGNTLALANQGLAKFACGGSNPVETGAKVIPSGWDTTVGNFTCQIRSFAVNCFSSKSNSGFTISRTGYSIY